MKNLAYLLITATALAACTNGRAPLTRAALTSSPSTGAVGVVAHPLATYRISSVDVGVPATSTTGSSSSSSGSSSGPPVTEPVTVRLDTTPPFTDFSTFCSLSGTVPCNCYFKWSEVNPNSSVTVTIPRYVETAVNLIQPSLAQCNSPDNWDTDVKDGTTVTMGIKPASGLSEFAMPAYSYVKNPSTVTGDFNDASGHSFDNILHYSCYEQFAKGNAIKNKTTAITVTNAGGAQLPSIPAMFANDFCVRNVEAGGTVPTGCTGIDAAVDFSAESNYYNLYTRAADRGTINGNSNGRYTCPQVEQPLSANGQATFWPLDSNFALSTSPNSDFSVAVDGFTKLSFGNDPTSQATTCYNTQSTSTASTTPGDTILTGCLGFAAKPKADGTCGTFKNAAGTNQALFRLRRYVAVYPPAFEADGQPYQQGQPTDVIYVQDRPVLNPNGDPTNPFTMLGPKPCPFAYFDHAAVARNTFSYVSTTNAGWAGKNYDGLQFPNHDDANTCSALVAIPDANKTRVSFATVNQNNPINTVTQSNPVTALNQVWIRPTHAWTPHYEEDTSFLACAPQSSPVKDPPLHFAKAADGNVAWCAEVYPSQNGNVERLDLLPGNPSPVVPFTSHTAKNSASPACVGRAPAALSAAYTGPARHTDNQTRTNLGEDGSSNVTCDRTVPAGLDAFYRVPLLAPPKDVESSISLDASFNCTLTYDAGGAKRGKATPTQGCCGAAVAVTTGAGGNQNAHLEPTGDGSTPTLCATPTY